NARCTFGGLALYLLGLGQILDHAGQHLGDFLGFGVLKIDHPHVAVLGLGTVHLVNQHLHPLTLQVVTTDDNAVDTLVGHHDHGGGGSPTVRIGFFQCRNNVDYVTRLGVTQFDQVSPDDRRLVNLGDQLIQANDVCTGIGDDQGVTGIVCRDMAILRHQGAQGRQHLSGTDVLELDDLGNVGVINLSHVGFIRYWQGTGIAVGNDAHHTAAFDGGVSVHVQHGEEEIVQLTAVQGAGRDNLDRTADLG